MQDTVTALQSRQASLLLWLGILAILIATMAIWGIAFVAFLAIGWTIYGIIRLGAMRPGLGILMLVTGCAATWFFGHQLFAEAWLETGHVFALHRNDFSQLLIAFGVLALSLIFWIVGLKTGRFWLVLRAMLSIAAVAMYLSLTYNAAEHGKTHWSPPPLHTSWPNHHD